MNNMDDHVMKSEALFWSTFHPGYLRGQRANELLHRFDLAPLPIQYLPLRDIKEGQSPGPVLVKTYSCMTTLCFGPSTDLGLKGSLKASH